MVIVLSLFVILVASICGAMSMLALVLILNRNAEDFMSPMSMTLFFIAIGSANFLATACLWFAETAGFPTLSMLVFDGNRIVRFASPSLYTTSGITLGLGQCFEACTVVFLPMYWIAITRRSLARVSKQTFGLLSKVAMSSVVAFLCVIVPLYSVASFDDSEYWVQIICLVFDAVYLVVIALNLIAFSKMFLARRAMLTDAPANSDGAGSSNAASNAAIAAAQRRRQRQQQQLARQRSSFLGSFAVRVALNDFSDRFVATLNRVLIASMTTALMSLTLIALSTQFPLQTSRTPTSWPMCDVWNDDLGTADLCFRVSVLIMQLNLAVALWFVWPSCAKKMGGLHGNVTGFFGGRRGHNNPTAASRPSLLARGEAGGGGGGGGAGAVRQSLLQHHSRVNTGASGSGMKMPPQPAGSSFLGASADSAKLPVQLV
jgi:hypothetical protein